MRSANSSCMLSVNGARHFMELIHAGTSSSKASECCVTPPDVAFAGVFSAKVNFEVPLKAIAVKLVVTCHAAGQILLNVSMLSFFLLLPIVLVHFLVAMFDFAALG